MTINKNSGIEIPFIHELCADKKEEEIFEAERNFKDCLLLITQISNRLEKQYSSQLEVDNP